MSITRRSGSFSAITIVLALVLAASAVVLAGCYETSPGGPKGTGYEEQKKLEVAKGDKAAIMTALGAAGISGNELYLYMEYASEAKDTVVVTGKLKREGAALSSATLTKSGDGWAVASAQ